MSQESNGRNGAGELVKAPLRLILNIGDTNPKTIAVKLKERITVGRAGTEGEQPDVDCSPFTALEKGVSRIHAVFLYQDEHIFLEDLASTNGTRINGLKLAPSKRYRLRNGDELEFGSLRMVVRLVRAPK
ncbi:MAG: FHA domain-containing protein [Chloroflexota bacterium]|nr:FHA domain-containing protein [Chloroflexota bacterium]